MASPLDVKPKRNHIRMPLSAGAKFNSLLKRIGLADGRVANISTALHLGSISYGRLAEALRALREDVDEVAKYTLFYHYPRDLGLLVLHMQGDWAATRKAFKKAMPDVEAGVDCLALGHGTASVFHMMRTAELGMRGLARELQVSLRSAPLEWMEWQTVIDQISTKYKGVRDGVPKGSRRDAIVDFYSGAVGEISAFKDEFRNHVMHSRRSYNNRHAMDVMLRVRSFMERLSAKTNENGKRIKWK